MLIRLIVENFLSFNKETEFNMLTSDVRRHPHHVYKNTKINIVKSAVIYGANGAGKSNLILAFELLKNIAVKNHVSYLFQNKKFKFGDIDKPTKIEIDFITKGKGYNYGLILNNRQIEEEWLYKLGFSDKTDELIFERKSNKGNKPKMKYNQDFNLDAKKAMLLEILEEEMTDNETSFIYAAKNKKFKDITNVWDWLSSCNEIVFPKGNSREEWDDFLQDTIYGCLDETYDFKEFCNTIIKDLDTGIFELAIVKMSLDEYWGNRFLEEKKRIINKLSNGSEEMLRDGPVNFVLAYLDNDIPMVKKMVANHKNNAGIIKQFELSEESEGTLRILEFLSLFNDLIYTSKTIFIDEIEQSIHPSLLKAIIRTVQEHKNIKGQLIFTTHESNLLDLDLFRQDEIWFAEKNKTGATELYSLSDYDVRPDLDIRKGYLSGRFGAIPFLANLKDINWSTNGKKAEPQL